MSESNTQQKLRQAWNLVKQGDKRQAGTVIKQVFAEDPNNADAFYLASYIANNPEKQVSYLEASLRNNPNHSKAQVRLEQLRSKLSQSQESHIPDISEVRDKVGTLITESMGLADSIVAKFTTDEQDPKLVGKVVNRVSEILTSDEEILYVAVRNVAQAFVANFSPDCVAATNRRFIVYKPHLLGGAEMRDYLWKDLQDMRLREGVLRAELTFKTLNGDSVSIDNLHKTQARKLYRIAQEIEERMIEDRRQKELEAVRDFKDKKRAFEQNDAA